jgi:hypothetical protein
VGRVGHLLHNQHASSPQQAVHAYSGGDTSVTARELNHRSPAFGHPGSDHKEQNPDRERRDPGVEQLTPVSAASLTVLIEPAMHRLDVLIVGFSEVRDVLRLVFEADLDPQLVFGVFASPWDVLDDLFDFGESPRQFSVAGLDITQRRLLACLCRSS